MYKWSVGQRNRQVHWLRSANPCELWVMISFPIFKDVKTLVMISTKWLYHFSQMCTSPAKTSLTGWWFQPLWKILVKSISMTISNWMETYFGHVPVTTNQLRYFSQQNHHFSQIPWSKSRLQATSGLEIQPRRNGLSVFQVLVVDHLMNSLAAKDGLEMFRLKTLVGTLFLVIYNDTYTMMCLNILSIT